MSRSITEVPCPRDGHGKPKPPAADDIVLIVGNPNVGKSVLFNWLTGRYVTVSNYPGTTVEVSRGRSKRLGGVEILDTPGMYSLTPITEEERVTQSILLTQPARAVIHVIDAKNITRMLGLTLQLIEAGLKVVLVLNLWDEAEDAGVKIDVAKLSDLLGIPVLPTVAISGKGLSALVDVLLENRGQAPENGDWLLFRRLKKVPVPDFPGRIDYGLDLEQAVSKIEPLLPEGGPATRRAQAVLLLHGEQQEVRRMTHACPPDAADEIARIVWDATMALKHTPHYHTAMAIKAQVQQIVSQAAVLPPQTGSHVRDRLSELCMNPWTGLPLLLAVLYFGLYLFVGSFGAGTLVDLLQNQVFGDATANPANHGFICPWLTSLANHYIPWQSIRDLFVGEYGIVTLGIRYAIAIVFPIVGTFFLAFSVLEDSGYLPRLAMLVDRLFKRIGLNGRAVIPMVLGFGCDTMATLVTRTLETKRERMIATFLLALAIPCSAQIGVIMGLLAGHPLALIVWATIIAVVFLGAGLMAAKFLPGERPSFYMELPPLRLPRIGNVLVKTYTRMVWYFKEVLPLFILASVVIWFGRMDFGGLLPQGGVFQMLVGALEPVVRSVGLPDKTAVAFLFGFFRRDYGAAGLKVMHDAHALVGNQLVVAAVMMTLFLPCIAQFLIMKKERGWRMTLAVSAFIVVFAYGVGWLVHSVLWVTGVQL